MVLMLFLSSNVVHEDLLNNHNKHEHGRLRV